MTGIKEVDILLVEDNPQDAELTIRALTKANLANQLVVVEDGAEALEFLERRGRYAARPAGNPLVVFLDLKLPKLSGLEVLRIVKQAERLRSIPIVVVTSSREDPDIAAAYALAANSYVVKPVDFEGFARAISSLGVYWLMVNQAPRR